MLAAAGDDVSLNDAPRQPLGTALSWRGALCANFEGCRGLLHLYSLGCHDELGNTGSIYRLRCCREFAEVEVEETKFRWAISSSPIFFFLMLQQAFQPGIAWHRRISAPPTFASRIEKTIAIAAIVNN